MKIVITGSSGYLGRHSTARALDLGHDVVGIDMKALGISHERFDERLIDIADTDAVSRAMEGVGAVFHLAAALAQFVRDESRMRRTNVDGTTAVLSAAESSGVKKLIYLSSVEVYGIDVPTPCPETAPLRPVCQYGREKVECEEMCREYGGRGMDVTVFRPPTIHGPGQNEPFLVSQLEAVFYGKPTLLAGGGKTRLQMVDVGDVVEAMFLALDRSGAKNAVMNLGSDDVPTMRRLVEALYEHAGRRPRFISVPAGPARAIARLLSLVGLSPVEPQHLEIALRDYVFDNSRAKELLGWRPKKSDIESAVAAYDYHVEHCIKKES